MLKTQTNSSVFGSIQNIKEEKPKPVRDEYEYVSDEGELKIDEFPIRRKKNAVKRDFSCKVSWYVIWARVIFWLNKTSFKSKNDYGLYNQARMESADFCYTEFRRKSIEMSVKQSG